VRDPSQDGHPFAAPSRITIVSGLPRSGTSLAMQLLAAAGLEIAQDGMRPPDPDNPRGYFELEAVKAIRRDARFLEGCRGRVVKIVAPLLTEIPPHFAYRVLFVERDLGEILASQRRLLERQERDEGQEGIASVVAADEVLARAFRGALDRCRAWLTRTPVIPALFVDHRALLESTGESVSRIARFLEQTGDGPRPSASSSSSSCAAAAELARAAMIRAVDPALYRTRRGS
jgi:hypothetical protein